MPPSQLCKRVFAIVALSAAAILVRAQEPPAPAPPPPPAPVESSTKTAKHTRHLDEFLIHGTVFDNKALSLPGAQLRLRRTSEKKYRWNAYTNSRGEFAIRVPPGTNYEVLVQSKGFADATQPVDAKNGLNDESMVFRMELASQRKK